MIRNHIYAFIGRILDEATERLAPLIARHIWRFCALVRATGISSVSVIVIVEKNWKHRTQITDRNVILVKGEVVFEGTSAALTAQPQLLQQFFLGGGSEAQSRPQTKNMQVKFQA